jgi:hypothetical protein
MANISFLLGAGFSVPAGYPTAFEVSRKLIDYDNRYVYATSGGIYYVKREFYSLDKDFFQKEAERTSWNGESKSWKEGALMLEVLIRLYRIEIDNDIKNYEHLYDFIISFKGDETGQFEKVISTAVLIEGEKANDINWKWWLSKLSNYKLQKDSYTWSTWTSNASICLDFIINDIISNLRNGKSFDYQNVISYIKTNLEHTIHIHTLNHDLLIEELLTSNDIDFTDGFEVGEFYSSESPIMKYYSGNFNTQVRLYKLHGSVDYWNYYYVINGRGTDKNVVIKHNYGDAHSFYIHDSNKAQIMAENSGLILSGTETKKTKYNGPLASDLLPIFKDNISHTNILIVIGYSFMDDIINDILDESIFQTNSKPIIAVGWRDAPKFLLDKNASNERITFHASGIDNYDFSDALLEPLKPKDGSLI